MLSNINASLWGGFISLWFIWDIQRILLCTDSYLVDRCST
ncbi:hypothetical protein KEN51_CDS0136 [Pseudomonas phage vB_Pae10145-KEN51]